MLPIRTILHPTDFSDQSAYAFQMACSLARDHGAKLVLLHVVQPPAAAYGEVITDLTSEADMQAMTERLAQVKAPDPQLALQRRVVEGNPAEEIVRTAAAEPCDLIVMGTHGRTGLGRLLMGSVAELTVRKAPCPVLTVKTPPSA